MLSVLISAGALTFALYMLGVGSKGYVAHSNDLATAQGCITFESAVHASASGLVYQKFQRLERKPLHDKL